MLGVDGELAEYVDRLVLVGYREVGQRGLDELPGTSGIVAGTAKGVPDHLVVEPAADRGEIAAGRVEVDQPLPKLVLAEPGIIPNRLGVRGTVDMQHLVFQSQRFDGIVTAKHQRGGHGLLSFPTYAEASSVVRQ